MNLNMECAFSGLESNITQSPPVLAPYTSHVIPISEDHVQVRNITRSDLPTTSQNEIRMT